MNCRIPGFCVLHYLQSLLKLISVESVMPSNHLILCCSLLLLPSVFPSIRVFSNESALCIRRPTYWSFSIHPSNEYSGLISSSLSIFPLFLLLVSCVFTYFLTLITLHVPSLFNNVFNNLNPIVLSLKLPGEDSVLGSISLFPFRLRLSTSEKNVTTREAVSSINSSYATLSEPSALHSNFFSNSAHWYFTFSILFEPQRRPPPHLANIPSHTGQMTCLLFTEQQHKPSYGNPSPSQHKNVPHPHLRFPSSFLTSGESLPFKLEPIFYTSTQYCTFISLKKWCFQLSSFPSPLAFRPVIPMDHK